MEHGRHRATEKYSAVPNRRSREEQIGDSRRRVAATRWPTRELVRTRSQGVQLATLQELARYWTNEYDWGKCEARLNVLPQLHDRDRRGGDPLHPRQVAS